MPLFLQERRILKITDKKLNKSAKIVTMPEPSVVYSISVIYAVCFKGIYPVATGIIR
jgi:hypothetical protein